MASPLVDESTPEPPGSGSGVDSSSTVPAAPPAVPAAPLARLARRKAVEDAWRAARATVLTPQDPAATERHLARGKLLARERIDQLLDPGSFQELEMMVYTSGVAQLRGKQAYGDGIVSGWGTISGRRTYVYAQDATVVGGSLGGVGGAKVRRLMDLAYDAGAPIIGILDGGGARIQEGVSSLVGFGGIFVRNVRSSGVVPQISLIMGVATGGAVYSPAVTDFVCMVEGTATLAITGPKVIKEVTGEDVTLDELGGAAVHGQRTGVVHCVVPDERSCFDAARRLLGFLPSNHREPPPTVAPHPPLGPNGWNPLGVLPYGDGHPYDVRHIVRALVDRGDLFEYAPGWAPNVVCALARMDGRSVGVVANQPDVDEGRLDLPACEKAARFVRMCDAFNVPNVSIVDSPGLAPVTAGGRAATEQGGLVRAVAKLLHARAEATTPRVVLVVGRARDEALLAMGVARGLSDVRLAWPTADLGPSLRVDGPHGPGPNGNSALHEAAAAGIVDRVITPPETREALVAALAGLPGQTGLERPLHPRKHDNIPL